jgi:hypothetical protein
MTESQWQELKRSQANREILVYIPSPYDSAREVPEIKHLTITDTKEN